MGGIGVLDLLEYLWDEQKEWSQATFGSDQTKGPRGSLLHLRKEVDEALNAPDDIVEYADCFNLLLDATRRAGFSLDDLIATGYAKLQTNKLRIWPKSFDPTQPVEHEREATCPESTNSQT